MSKLRPFIQFSYSYLLLTCFVLLYTNVSAFVPDNEWKLFTSVGGINIYTSTEECHDFKNGTHYEYILLKFVNTNNAPKKISWSENLYYNGICNGCDGKGDKKLFEVLLNSNESLEGGCGIDNSDTFRIFNRFLNYTDKPILTNYELKNLIVTDR